MFKKCTRCGREMGVVYVDGSGQMKRLEPSELWYCPNCENKKDVPTEKGAIELKAKLPVIFNMLQEATTENTELKRQLRAATQFAGRMEEMLKMIDTIIFSEIPEDYGLSRKTKTLLADIAAAKEKAK